jgi:DNA invertase Pin-like site-specific DNA recombinase
MSKPSSTAVSYLRVSGLAQVKGDGFTRQREAVEARAAANGLELVGEYRDEGVSGTIGLDSRPGLSALLERVLSNGVRIVIVERADRIARDLIQSELILDELRKAGVSVIEAESGRDLASKPNATAVLIRQVLGAVAEFEKSSIVAKLAAARARKRKETGRCEGQKPYSDEIVREVRRLRRKNPKTGRVRGYGAIAKEMSRLGHPTKKGGPWTASTIQTILRRVA